MLVIISLYRDIEGEYSCPCQHERDRDRQEEQIVVDAVGEECLVADLEADLDEQDDGVQHGRDLGP